MDDMGRWTVDGTSEPGILRLKLEGTRTVQDLRAFVEAHNRAIDTFDGQDYKVWCEIATMDPLSAEASMVFEEGQCYSSAHRNFRGSAVLVASNTTALQHRHSSIRSRVMDTEFIGSDVNLLREHLRTVYRSS